MKKSTHISLEMPVVSDTKGENGVKYKKHVGLCLETQGLPNALNQPKFLSIVYNLGQVYT